MNNYACIRSPAPLPLRAFKWLGVVLHHHKAKSSLKKARVATSMPLARSYTRTSLESGPLPCHCQHAIGSELYSTMYATGRTGDGLEDTAPPRGPSSLGRVYIRRSISLLKLLFRNNFSVNAPAECTHFSGDPKTDNRIA